MEIGKFSETTFAREIITMWHIQETFYGVVRTSPGYSSEEEARRIITEILYPNKIGNLGLASIIYIEQEN